MTLSILFPVSGSQFALLKKIKGIRELPGGLELRIQCFHCHGPDSIPSGETEIPEAAWHGPEKENK